MKNKHFQILPLKRLEVFGSVCEVFGSVYEVFGNRVKAVKRLLHCQQSLLPSAYHNQSNC